ncbi:hypothetical protein QEN19_003928 [Hanseniaspora menglaensis]
MSFRNNNSKNYRVNNRFNNRTAPKQNNKCDICGEKEFKYKCSKCTIQITKICSMECYKEHNMKGDHKIEKEITVENKDTSDEKNTEIDEIDKKEGEEKKNSLNIDPDFLEKYKPLLDDPKIQELLKYNTVKYHLNKIYQLLHLDYKSIQEDTITSQKDLDEAVSRYLSCFRRNGIYKNEAIEEFVLLVLDALKK